MIHTLITDIYKLIESKNGWFTNEISAELADSIAKRLQVHLTEQLYKKALRMSKLGPQCPKALWTSVHYPEMAEPLPAPAMIKYSFGHIIEALAICLARSSGHSVTGEQDELVLDNIVGHRDCVIDGAVVDVKSTSSFSFNKFKDRTLAQSDYFGYLDQLDAYVVASLQDPLVTVKDRGYILAIDKQLGKMVLYEHRIREDQIRSTIDAFKEIVGRPESPSCKCGTVADGKSGNIKLDVKASYSAFKHSCFPDLRTFLYAGGPVYLTHVERKPDVPEVDKFGNLIYR